MTGNAQSIWPLDWPGFYLDSCLPWTHAQALSIVEYPITWPDEHGRRDTPDPDLIPWLGEQRFVWITRDDDAKKSHRELILQHRVPVIWVRGVDRGKKNLSMHAVFGMLAARLPLAARNINESRTLLHQMLYLNGEKPTLAKVRLDSIASGQPLREAN